MKKAGKSTDLPSDKKKELVKHKEPVQALYERLTSDREEFLERARINAKVTIPSLMKPDGHGKGDDLYIPYQSLGAQSVSTLAEKLVTAILPPNAPFIKSTVDDYAVELVAGSDQRAEVDKALNERDRAVADEVEGLAIRPALSEIMLQLLVAGNVLAILPDKGTLETYRLDRYVVQRSPSGEWVRIIIKETVAFEVIPEEVRVFLKEQVLKEEQSLKSEKKGPKTDEIDIYTHYWIEGKMVHRVQCVKGYEIPSTHGRWKQEETPVMPLRLFSMTGEDYGRSYVDSYVGDLQTAEGLSRAIVEATAAGSKVVFLVRPNGLTEESDVVSAENLDVITGSAEDVTVLQVDKRADLQAAREFLNEIQQRLSRAFLMVSSVQRNAERVTAEEIREVVGELESVLGGVYSLLANEFQLPFAKRLISRMEKEKKIPKISDIKGAEGRPAVKPKLTGGLEALGRGQDTRTLSSFVKELAEITPALKGLESIVHINELVLRMANARNIDGDGLLKTEEDRKADLQKQQQMMMQQQGADIMKSAAGPAIKAASDNPEAAAAMAQQMVPQQ